MSRLRRFAKVGIVLLLGAVSLAFFTAETNNKYFEIAKNIEIFTNLYKEINVHYVDEVDPSKLMRTGLDAMLESLDPFTNYISESEIESYRYITEGKYNGIGAVIQEMNDEIVITEPYANSPAVEAGLKAGDVILEIDGKSTKGKSADDVTDFLRGYPGTQIEFTIQRPGESKPQKIKMTRGEVSIPNVPYSGIVGEDVGYIALTTFTRNAGRNVGNALRELKEEKPDLKGVILDLRGNGGGLLSEAVNVSNTFIPKGELVASTRGKIKERDRSFSTRMNPVDVEIPVIVLINNRSASASEIVSGTLQDYDRGVLMGQRTYGKGLVQNTKDVGYNSKLKLTTAKYYIPSGRCIQSVEYEDGEPVNIEEEKRAKFKTNNGRIVLDGGGVKPDVVLESPSDLDIVKSLEKDHVIFDFATQYYVENESIGEAKSFQFTNYDQFLQYLKNKDFEYRSDTHKALAKLEEVAEKEGQNPAILTDIAAIKSKLSAKKENDLVNHKDVITNLLAKEIVGRYHYQKGKIEASLNSDPEIKAAIELFNDPDRYNQLLKP